MPDVLVVGTFPPPVHGASLVTDRVADALAAALRVERLDLEPDPARRVARKPFRYARALDRVVRGGSPSLYLAASGGEAISADAAVCGAARARGHRIVVHHHSDLYTRTRSRPLAALIAAAGTSAVHVVGCAGQADRLRARYRGLGEIRVLSNTCVVPDPGPPPPREASTGVVLGHLSNLSLDKGLDDVVALTEALRDDGTAVTLVLGGPVGDDRARACLAAARRRLGTSLHELGPLDEGAKAEFYGQLDLFVFPSRYRHESHPLVVHEAMAAGVPVVATAVGCIAGQVGEGGACTDPTEAFVPQALAALAKLRDASLPEVARSTYLEQRSAAEGELQALVRYLAGD